MTTWPPRERSCIEAYRYLMQQEHSEPVKFILVLSKEEWGNGKANPSRLLKEMEELGVEVIWDEGNIYSHKKLIPTLESYPNYDILVCDDDGRHQDGWLQTFIDDHKKYLNEIIYGVSISKVEVIGKRIYEDNRRFDYTSPGKRTLNLKPANGAGGTLYPAGTFTDPRFFDRDLFMHLSPTSDETWQWAWAVMAGRQYRCLSKHNYSLLLDSNQECALWNINRNRYNEYHNAIAGFFPEYRDKLIELLNKKEQTP